MKTKLIPLIIIGALFSGIQVKAEGGSHVGGGDAIVCSGGLFDLYGLLNLFMSNPAELTDLVDNKTNLISKSYLDAIDGDIVTESVLKFIKATDPGLAAKLNDAFLHLDFVEGKPEVVETGVHVSGLEKVFGGCSRKTLAAQHFNTWKGQPRPGYSTVVLSKRVRKLQSIVKGFLKIHEAFIYLASYETDDIEKMETLARANVFKLYNQKGLFAFLIPDSYRSAGKPLLGSTHQSQLEMANTIFDWAGSPPDSNLRQATPAAAYFTTGEMLGAGLDPNLEVACKMPLLDWAIIHATTFTWAVGDTFYRAKNYPASEIALAILEHGASVTKKDFYGRSPLLLATYTGETKVVDALIAKGADVNEGWCSPGLSEGKYPVTALDIVDGARQGQYAEVARSLKAQGAKHGSELGQTCGKSSLVSMRAREDLGCDDFGVLGAHGVLMVQTLYYY